MKKHLSILVLLVLISNYTNSQEITLRLDELANKARESIIQERTEGFIKDDKDNKSQSINKLSNTEAVENKYGIEKEGISFGLSLGFSSLLSDHKDALISPIDQKLIITNNQRASFLISSVISFPLGTQDKNGAKVKISRDKNGDPVGKAKIPSNWSLLAIVNIAQFNNSTTNTIFNQRISGGLGFSYSFTHTLSIGASFELNSVIQPRDFLLDLEGQSIIIDEETIENLDINDRNFFKEEYLPSISLKLIYKIKG